MSLINEALKKAQSPRPAGSGPSPDSSGAAGSGKGPAPPPRNRLRYLWGFLLSVLIVGILSTAFTSFFIWQLLGEEEQEPSHPPARESSELPTAPAKPVAEKTRPEEPDAVLPEEPSPATPPEASPELPSSGLATAPPTAPTEPSAPPPPPDPAVISRLLELEIRGVMSGGTRILLHDKATDRTKAYMKGETLEGSFGLTIESISKTSIEFKDHAGNIHTKSF